MPRKPRSIYFTISLHAFVVLAGLLVVYQVLNSLGDLLLWLRTALNVALDAMMPFIVAVVIAYLLRPPVDALERLLNSLMRHVREPRKRAFALLTKMRLRTRLIAVGVVYALLAVLLGWLAAYVFPLVVRNAYDMGQQLPTFTNDLFSYVREYALKNPDYPIPGFGAWLQEIVDMLRSNAMQIVTTAVAEIARRTYDIVSTTVRLSIAFVLAFYLLCDSVGLYAMISRVLRRIIGAHRTASFIRVFSEFDNMFSRYLVGRMLESLTVGVLCYIVLRFAGTRYDMLLSAFYAIANMVPYIGPLVALIPIMLVSLLDSPTMAIILALALTGVQSLDAWVIGPAIMGDRLGLNPFWVILSITIGGALFGVWGLVLSTPVMAVLLNMVTRSPEPPGSPEPGSPSPDTPSPDPSPPVST